MILIRLSKNCKHENSIGNQEHSSDTHTYSNTITDKPYLSPQTLPVVIFTYKKYNLQFPWRYYLMEDVGNTAISCQESEIK